MKLFFFSLFLSIITINAKAQSFNISADKMNIAYIGIENPLTIVADNVSCTDLKAITDNGTIEKKDGCHFYFEPHKQGVSIITIQQQKNGKIVTIGTQNIRAKIIPDPIASVGGKTNGFFAVELFKVQQGISIKMPNFYFDVKFIAKSFLIEIKRNDKIIYSETIDGNLFTGRSKAGFSQLKGNDIVRITNIKCIGPDSIVRSMNDLSYTMR